MEGNFYNFKLIKKPRQKYPLSEFDIHILCKILRETKNLHGLFIDFSRSIFKKI